TIHPENFYAVMIVFAIANILMLSLGWVAAKSARWIFEVPRALLNAAILLFRIVGSYSINNTMFGVWLMLAAGVVAYVLEARMIAIAPIILGIVLGPLVETNFTTSMMIADGNLIGFFERPAAATFGIVTLSIWGIALYRTVTSILASRQKATAPF